MTRLSEHFMLEELTKSEYALRHSIDNEPPTELHPNLKALAGGLERVREVLGAPMIITSGYRSPAVNSGIGGSQTSAHMRGLAADFVCPQVGDPGAVARIINAHGDAIAFDQLIWEFGQWVHCAFAAPNAQPRRQVLTIWNSRQGYLDGLVPKAEA